MKTKELIQELLFEERKVPDGKRYIALFDIDQTLVVPGNISIWKKKVGENEVALTPDQYAKENVVEEKKNGTTYDYREFRDPKKVKESIAGGAPISKNVKMMNDHVKNGWSVGILTARGLEDVIFDSIKQWLMFRKETALLPSLGKSLARNLVHAVNDEVIKYEGMTDFEKKSNVIRKYAKEYDRVKFIDDDDFNVNAVKKMKLPNVIAVKAWPV